MEFKASMRWDYAADNGNILGIEKYFETFSDRKNWDGWSQHVVNVVLKHMGTEFLGT